jgi:hypothetical protein
MKHILPIVVAIASQSLLAETVVQSANFSASNEGNLYSGFGSDPLVAGDFFTATVQPFNAALGTLQSFTIRCDIEGMLTGTIGEEAEEGSAMAFSGTGGGNNGVGSTGEPIEVSFAIPTFEQTMTVANAGVTYDPNILSKVTGAEPFPVAFDTPVPDGTTVTVGYQNVSDLAASVSGTIAMTYTYETGAGTEALRITSFIRDGVQQTVSIQWTSAEGKTYAVEAWDGTGGWSTIAPTVTGGNFTEEDVPATVLRRFYRVREND